MFSFDIWHYMTTNFWSHSRFNNRRFSGTNCRWSVWFYHGPLYCCCISSSGMLPCISVWQSYRYCPRVCLSRTGSPSSLRDTWWRRCFGSRVLFLSEIGLLQDLLKIIKIIINFFFHICLKCLFKHCSWLLYIQERCSSCDIPELIHCDLIFQRKYMYLRLRGNIATVTYCNTKG